MTTHSFSTWTLVLALGASVAVSFPARADAAGPAAAPVVRFDPSKYSQAVTECDRLASHPEDPHRVAPGRERSTCRRRSRPAARPCRPIRGIHG
jgi:hypothetical protein